MSSREWTSIDGRTLLVSVTFPSPTPMATPPNWPRDKPPATPETPYLTFTDPRNPANRRSTLFNSEKDLTKLTDDEVGRYWALIVETHPEFAGSLAAPARD